LDEQASQAGFQTLNEYVVALLMDFKSRQGNEPALRRAADASSSKPWEIALSIGAGVPVKDWAGVPSDLARNFDHYLYGARRVE